MTRFTCSPCGKDSQSCGCKFCIICRGNARNCDCLAHIKHGDYLKDRIGSYKPLRGRQNASILRGACPIHRGQDYNLEVKYDSAMGWRYQCHSRCKGEDHGFGDVFDLIRYTTGLVEFKDQVELLLGRSLNPPPTPKPPSNAPSGAQTLKNGWDFVRAYEAALRAAQRAWWYERGADDPTIERFHLGYCTQCPMARFTPSYTIPVIEHGIVRNIRHRLAQSTDPSDKYRPQDKGLGLQLFNSDSLWKDPDGDLREGFKAALLVEGEVKNIVNCRFGMDTMMGVVSSTGGVGSWLGSYGDQWIGMLRQFDAVYVAFDPDAIETAEKVTKRFGRRGHLLDFPMKMDDFLLADERNLNKVVDAIFTARPYPNVSYWEAATLKPRIAA